MVQEAVVRNTQITSTSYQGGLSTVSWGGGIFYTNSNTSKATYGNAARMLGLERVTNGDERGWHTAFTKYYYSPHLNLLHPPAMVSLSSLLEKAEP